MFTKSSCKGANFEGSDLTRVDFIQVNLQGANLKNTDLRGARLHSTEMDTNTSFAGALYDEHTSWPRKINPQNLGAFSINALQGANLVGWVWINRDLKGVDLQGANLQGADLSEINLESADLEGANLSAANLEGVFLTEAYLQGANLAGANLSGAYLSDTNLQGVHLQGADLTKSSLQGANLTGANLTGVNLSGANLEYVRYDGMFEASLIPWFEVQFDDETVFPEAWIKDRLGTVKKLFSDIERRLNSSIDQSSPSVSEDILYVVHENEVTVDSRYRTDRESTIVGVTNCKEEALRMMNRTFFERLSRTDTTDSVKNIVEILIKKYGGRLLLFEEIYKVIQVDVTWMDCVPDDSHTLWYGTDASDTTSWTVQLSEVVPILK